MSADRAYLARLRIGLPDTERELWAFRARAHAWMYWSGEARATHCIDCQRPVVCALCDACADHCVMPHGPDECWEVHEAWRHGRADRVFDAAFVAFTPPPGAVAPAPLPRWIRTP